jgi:hypothetical protein
MWQLMPLKGDERMKKIYAAWLVPIGLGMAFSGAVFYIDAQWAAQMVGHLGAFWLGVMAVGYFLNGLFDAPSGWYWFAAVINAVACALCFTLAPFELGQYLIAAIISAWSLVNLWLFRSWDA